MKNKLIAADYENNTQIEISFEPTNICPICHTSFNGMTLSGYILPLDIGNGPFVEHKHVLYTIHYCSVCEKGFFGIYGEETEPYVRCRHFSHVQSFPELHKPEAFSDCIERLSPSFIKTYNQALSAEKEQLSDICGFGYRRALEFLIKDFAIFMHNEDEEKIKEMAISQCINKYIEYPKLKTAATKAIWLGNDHSHYVVKHTDKDLDDLKLLVNLSVHWIIMEMETLNAESIPKL